MKQIIPKTLFTVLVVCLFSVTVQAADYTFSSDPEPEYYDPTSYEQVYGSQYHYGGTNLIDYQIPDLKYGVLSTTQTGIMEKVRLPGLQAMVSTGGSGYGITAEGGLYTSAPELNRPSTSVIYREPAYTSAEDMERKDGSIGTVKIPSLDINMKVWEGETNASMAKGLGHYRSTSAWDGNVAVCGVRPDRV